MVRSHFEDLLDGYEEPVDTNGEPLPLGKRFFVREITGSMTANTRRRASSRFYQAVNSLLRLITYTKAKSYGAMAMAFGILTFVFGLIKIYFGIDAQIETATTVICTVSTFLGALLLFSEKPISIILQDFSVTDFIFFEFFCMQRVHRKSGEASVSTVLAVIIGAVFALVTLLVSPLQIAAVFLLILFVAVAFSSPEFSYIAILISLPYLDLIPNSLYILISVVLITAISFARKVLWGKRVVFFEQYDFWILLMMFMILISGTFIKGISSFASSAILCVASLGYFLTSSIITNRRLADRVMNAVVVSSVPAAIYSLVSYVLKCVGSDGFAAPCESAFFADTSIYATFLLIAVFFGLAHTVQTHAPLKKLSYLFALTVDIFALLTTGEVFAVAAVFFGGVAYILFKQKSAIVTAIAAPMLLVIPYAVFLLPKGALDGIFDFVPSVESFGAYADTLVCSLTELGKNFLFGIGIGADSFAEQMASHGVSASSSGNLFVELALESGVLALLLFILLLASRIRHRIFYRKYVRVSVVKHSQPIVCAAICALIFYGSFCYLWADVKMFYLFFTVFAIESAMLRVSRKATDERILYYEDAKSSESSAVDIGLHESSNHA